MLVSIMAMLNNHGVTKMRIESYQLFSHLCESLVLEASSSLDLVKQVPGGKQVIQNLHQEQGLSHDQKYHKIDKISWSELKDNYSGAWVIVQGTKGVGAIRAYRGSYRAVASAGEPVQSFSNDRGGNIIDFLKGIIGGLKTFHVGRDSNARKELVAKRADMKKGSSVAPTMDVDKLILKFSPLWLKAIRAAQADIKGMVANMIKNDAFEKAKSKLDALGRLESAADSLEAGDKTPPDYLEKALRTAVTLSAGHHYPDLTGEITRSRYGSGGLTSQNSAGAEQLLKDIAAGDQKKLGTVLGFFKRSLISL